MSLAFLRQQIATIEAQRPSVLGLSTGVDTLDAALSGAGVPRGRLTELVGARGSGKTTLLRQLVRTTAQAGLRVAYVDASRTLTPRDWAPLPGEKGRVRHGRRGRRGDPDEPDAIQMVRPKQADRGAWCADILLRSGAFALVVLDGAPPLSRAVAVRLTRLARDAGAALVVVGEDEASRTGNATLVGGALRLRLKRRTTVAITVGVERGGRGGHRRTIEVSYAVSVARRLCTHSEVPDRRGVARSRSATAPARAVAADAARPAPPSPGDRVLSRKRRCAEPDFGGEPRVPGSTLLAGRTRCGVG